MTMWMTVCVLDILPTFSFVSAACAIQDNEYKYRKTNKKTLRSRQTRIS